MAGHFIHSLGPLVVGVVETTSKSETTFDAAVVTRACQVLEGLLDMVSEGHSEFVVVVMLAFHRMVWIQ